MGARAGEDPIVQLAFANRGTRVLGLDHSALRAWDTATGKLVSQREVGANVPELVIPWKGDWLAFDWQSVSLWDAASCTERARWQSTEHINCVAITPSGTVALGTQRGLIPLLVMSEGAGAEPEAPIDRARFEVMAAIQREVLSRGRPRGRWVVAQGERRKMVGYFDGPSERASRLIALDGAALPDGLDLSGIELPLTSWVGVRAHRVVLAGADLSGACLALGDFTDGDLRNARLAGANLERARLAGCDLRGADLTGADLQGADLRGANLDGATLDDAHLKGARRAERPRKEPDTKAQSLDRARKLIKRAEGDVLSTTKSLRAAAKALEGVLVEPPAGFAEVACALGQAMLWEEELAREAPKWLRVAGDAGNATADWRLGAELIDGELLPEELRDVAEGLRLLERSVAAGAPPAMCRLGCYLLDGEVCPQDRDRARELVQRAADAGHAGACAELGDWYARGEFGEADPVRALAWYERGGSTSDEAAAEAALCYHLGLGTTRDAEKAAYWYHHAASLGFEWKHEERWKGPRPRRLASGRRGAPG